MKSTIVLGQIDLSFHKATAGVFHKWLLNFGYDVVLKTAPHEEMFALQAAGEIDILISAWLPGSHGKYLANYDDKVISLATIYTPFCVWCVPEYIPEELLKTVFDLNDSKVIHLIEKEINGIGMGAGISRFTIEMLSEYELDNNGYYFTSNNFNTFTQIIEKKLQKNDWFVIPLWIPQYLFKMHKLRVLEEPKGLLRGMDNATPLLLKSSIKKFRPEHLDFLSKMVLNNETVTMLDYLISKKGLSPLEAANQL